MDFILNVILVAEFLLIAGIVASTIWDLPAVFRFREKYFYTRFK